jgi:hypothetical protein
MGPRDIGIVWCLFSKVLLLRFGPGDTRIIVVVLPVLGVVQCSSPMVSTTKTQWYHGYYYSCHSLGGTALVGYFEYNGWVVSVGFLMVSVLC